MNPSVANVGGLQSQGANGAAVVHYRKPLATRDLEPSDVCNIGVNFVIY
jgi:hypothetical protein